MSVLAPLSVGILFGALLQRAGLTSYLRIVGVYRLADLTVLKFLLTAIAVGSLAIQGALSLGLVQVVPIPGTHLGADLLGGALFGVGMALAGFCPGTIAAGAGTGQVDYLIPGFAGLLVGALLYGWSYDSFAPALARAGAAGATTIPEQLGVDPWLVAILLGELSLLAFYAIERGVRRVREERREQALRPSHAGVHH